MIRKQDRFISSAGQARKNQTFHFCNQSFPLLLLLLSAAMLAGPFTEVARAQSGGEITGTVTDPTGAVVPNVDVKVTSIETGNSSATRSNGAGIFDFPGLDNGDYNLTASAAASRRTRKTPSC